MTFKTDLREQLVVNELHAANTKRQSLLLFLLADGYKTTLDLECFQIVCTGDLCKMKTIDLNECNHGTKK